MFKKRKKQEELFLSEGVVLRQDAWKQEENRIFTLLLKGVLVYLIVMGGMGCYLSALDINCAWYAVHLVVFLGAMFCSLLYYNGWFENLGYIFLFICMLAAGLMFRNYISSGFFVVLNRLHQRAAIFFDSEAVRTYTETVSNRYLSASVSMCYIGWVACVLMNVLISRRMQYAAVVPMIAVILFFPLYIKQEPSFFYVAMLLTGLLGSYAIRGNKHYKLSKKNDCYEFSKKTKEISYLYAGKTVGSALLLLGIVITLTGGIFALVYPENDYDNDTVSSLKAGTMEGMENFMLLGIMGLFNQYQSTGGLTSGRLGGVSSVRLDYETDLVLEYVPYSNGRIYLKDFVGAEYLPRNNRWQVLLNDEGKVVEQFQISENSVSQRKEDYIAGKEPSAEAKMKIKNVAAPPGRYLPYYSENSGQFLYQGQNREHTFYPLPAVSKVSLSADAFYPQWREVPEENISTIAEFCREAGLKDTDEPLQTVAKLAAYYQENIPYTLRPGATPYGEDFINYFLTKNRKGYCAHFASAATLIFRYLGIPARYIEGYAVDPSDLSDEGTILGEKNTSDYYKGDNPIGQSAVVSVNVSDAGAHAWVEIYIEGTGWQVVEVTPASTELEIAGNMSMWQRLVQLFGASPDDAIQTPTDDTGSGTFFSRQTQQMAKSTIFILLGAFAIGFGGIFLFRFFKARYAYAHAGINDRIILDYQSFLHRREKNPDFIRKENYRKQLEWMYSQGMLPVGQMDIENYIRILEKAGFSEKEVSAEEVRKIKELYHLK